MINKNVSKIDVSKFLKFLKISTLTLLAGAVSMTLVKFTDKDLKKAAKDLRTRLGLSQEAFGQRIGRTLNTVLRYESQTAPKEESLVRYAALAIDSGFVDLATIFRLALIQDLGADLVRVLDWKPPSEQMSVSTTEDMSGLIEAFLAFMSKPNEELQPAETFARASIKQMLLKQHSTEKGRARKTK